MRIGILYSRIRAEEKLIVEAVQARGLDYEMIDVRTAVFDLDQPEQWQQYDVILERCVSHSTALSDPTPPTASIFTSFGSTARTALI